MSDTNKLFFLMIIIGIASIVFTVLGLSGLSEEVKRNKSSKYYVAVGTLIFGIMMGLPFITFISFRLNYIKLVNKITGDMLSVLLVVFAMFVTGTYVFINKKKIDDERFVSITTQGLIFSVPVIIAIVYFGIKRHGFN